MIMIIIHYIVIMSYNDDDDDDFLAVDERREEPDRPGAHDHGAGVRLGARHREGRGRIK